MYEALDVDFYFTMDSRSSTRPLTFSSDARLRPTTMRCGRKKFDLRVECVGPDNVDSLLSAPSRDKVGEQSTDKREVPGPVV